MATPTLSDMLVRRTRLPDGAKFSKYCQKSLFSKNLPTLLAIFFMPKCCHFLKYQLSVLTKQSILDYLSNENPNFRAKIHINIKRCELPI